MDNPNGPRSSLSGSVPSDPHHLSFATDMNDFHTLFEPQSGLLPSDAAFNTDMEFSLSLYQSSHPMSGIHAWDTQQRLSTPPGLDIEAMDLDAIWSTYGTGTAPDLNVQSVTGAAALQPDRGHLSPEGEADPAFPTRDWAVRR